MNSTKSVLVLLTLVVLATAVWGVWKVLRIEPLEPMAPTAIETSDPTPTDAREPSESALHDPGDELTQAVPIEDARIEAADADAADTDAPDPEALAGPSSAMLGFLYDEHTREPLPEYLLKLQDEAGRRTEVTTDANGQFLTTIALAHGTIEIRPVDHPKRTARMAPIRCQHPAPEGREIQLTVASGPTYRLVFEPTTISAVDLEARLRISGNDVRGGNDFDPVREGPPAWVRFPPVSGDSLEARAIEVRARDGLSNGRAQVSRASGVVPGVVPIVLEKRAVFAGRVVDADGKPIEGATVGMRVTAGETVGLDRSATTKADGEWRFDLLPAGSGLLAIRAFRFEPQQDIRFALVPGEVTQQTITLVRIPPAGALRGRVTSESGRYDSPLEVQLTSIENPGRGAAPQRAQITWSDSGQQRIGTFEYTDLPAGKYRVAGRSLGSWYELAPDWKPDALLVSPPNDALSFLILDNTARADLVLRVRDVHTGETVEGFRGWFEIGKRDGRARDLESGEVAISGMPYEQTLRWRVDKAGYQPVIGDAASFGLEERHDGKVQRIAELALVRGWGELFFVGDRDGKNPVAGARILLDGIEAGISDERGFAFVRANAQPTEVRVEHTDWNMRGRVDRSPATRRKFQYFNPVRMSPVRKKS